MKPLISTYKPAQAAELLGISKLTILSNIKSGALPCIRYNRRCFRITAVDLAAWYATAGGRLKSSTTHTTATTAASA